MPRIPMFKMGKLRPREIKCLAQGRVPGRWWSWDLEPRRVTAEGWSGTGGPMALSGSVGSQVPPVLNCPTSASPGKAC